MSSDLHETSTGVSIDHVLAGLTVWAVMMVVFVLVL